MTSSYLVSWLSVWLPLITAVNNQHNGYLQPKKTTWYINAYFTDISCNHRIWRCLNFQGFYKEDWSNTDSLSSNVFVMIMWQLGSLQHLILIRKDVLKMKSVKNVDNDCWNRDVRAWRRTAAAQSWIHPIRHDFFCTHSLSISPSSLHLSLARAVNPCWDLAHTNWSSLQSKVGQKPSEDMAERGKDGEKQGGGQDNWNKLIGGLQKDRMLFSFPTLNILVILWLFCNSSLRLHKTFNGLLVYYWYVFVRAGASLFFFFDFSIYSHIGTMIQYERYTFWTQSNTEDTFWVFMHTLLK